MSTTIGTETALDHRNVPEPAKRNGPGVRAVSSILVSVVGMAAGFMAVGALTHRSTARPAAPTTWTRVALDDATSISLPPGATHESQEVPVGNATFTIDMWKAHSGSFDYSAARTPLEQLPVGLDPTAALRGAASGAFAGVHIEQPQLTATTIAGAPALRGVGTVANVTVQGAFVYTNGSLYELVVAGPHAQPGDLDALVAGFSTRG